MQALWTNAYVGHSCTLIVARTNFYASRKQRYAKLPSRSALHCNASASFTDEHKEKEKRKRKRKRGSYLEVIKSEFQSGILYLRTAD